MALVAYKERMSDGSGLALCVVTPFSRLKHWKKAPQMVK